MKANMRPVVVRWLIILGITAIVFWLIMLQAGNHARIYRNARRAQTHHQELEVVIAMNGYVAEYGAPVSGDPAQIIALLSGQNQRKIVFMEFRQDRFNSKGELTDEWGTPYHFDLSKPDAPRIWSCGPNRTDESGAEGSDDIVSWR
jgi:hypothetical protein